jgi:predicted ATP-dependent endonuclease of OLD family
MKLVEATITGYRSIRESLLLGVDGRVTVVLGANDHGKSNVLEALLHLNEDRAYATDDLNWDRMDEPDQYPAIEWIFELDSDERAKLLAVENARRRRAGLDEFQGRLKEAADEAKQAADEAREKAETAATELTSLREMSADEETDGPSVNAMDEAAAAAATAEELRAEADNRARTAQHRVFLAEAERLGLEAELGGGGEFELADAAEDAANRTTQARKAATRANGKVEEARTHVEELEGQQPQDEDQIAAAKNSLAEAETAAQEAETHRQAAEKKSQNLAQARDAVALQEEGELGYEEETPRPEPDLLSDRQALRRVSVHRVGVEGSRELADAGKFDPETTWEFIRDRLPRIELISLQGSVGEVTDADSIDDSDASEFMRGIFYYAGLQPDMWKGLFREQEQSTGALDQTGKRLDEAAAVLNTTLRDSWSQGERLEFKLEHVNEEIHLQIKDPSVSARYVRPSQRSAGFTHFFALKTVLYARERASGASSFIWLFDEPGIYLHPAGQYDLVKVIETLAQANQVIYATHSVFLINKNHPTRHRLLLKTEDGTEIDHKPYVGQWRSAFEALGLGLPGSMLFASKVLLAEGDSDPIFLLADWQKLIELGDVSLDINSLAVLSTGDSKHADALARIVLDGPSPPELALLFDGDKGGLRRLKSLKRLVEVKELPHYEIPDGRTIEDSLLSPELFRDALISYMTKIAPAGAKVEETIRGSWDKEKGPDIDGGLAAWSRTVGEEILGEGNTPSPVGIASEYARMLTEADPKELAPKTKRKNAIKLANEVSKMLDLRLELLEPSEILEDLDEDAGPA